VLFADKDKFALLQSLADIAIEQGDDSLGITGNIDRRPRGEVHPVLLAAGDAVSGGGCLDIMVYCDRPVRSCVGD
jgi:hypothetical protein